MLKTVLHQNNALEVYHTFAVCNRGSLMKHSFSSLVGTVLGKYWPLILVCTLPDIAVLGLMFSIEFNTASTFIGYTELLLFKRDQFYQSSSWA